MCWRQDEEIHVPLINRLQPVAFERLESYAERLRRANYYEELEWYRDLLVPPLPQRLDLLRAILHYVSLSEATGLSHNAIYDLTLHRFTETFLDSDHGGIFSDPSAAHTDIDRPLWSYDTTPPYIRDIRIVAFCPRCYADNQAFLLPWLLGLVTTCPIHQILLVDRCSNCGTPLRTDTRSGNCRSCGINFSEFLVHSVAEHADSKYVMRLVWSILGYGFDASNLSDSPLALHHAIRSVPQMNLLSWLWRGTELIAEYDSNNPIFDRTNMPIAIQNENPPVALKNATVAEAHLGLCGMGRLLNSWSDSWDETIVRITTIESYQQPGKQRFLDVLAREFRGQQWEWLQYHALPSHRLKEIQAEVKPKKPPRRWLPPQTLSDNTTLQSPNVLLNLEQTATLLELREQQVVAIIMAGLLNIEGDVFNDHVLEWRIKPDIALKFIKVTVGRLVLKASPRYKAPFPLPLDRIIDFLGRNGTTISQILVAIREGELPAFRTQDNLSLSDTWATSQDVRLFRERMPKSLTETSSSEQVCKQLGCDRVALRQLYGKGRLVPIRELGDGADVQWWYDPKVVTAFMKHDKKLKALMRSVQS
jgi:hypothetical protein